MKNGKEKRKINLVIIGELIGGGVEKVNTTLATNINKNMFEVTYICLTTNPKVIKDHYNFNIIFINKKRNKYAILKLYKELKKICPNVILICNIVESFVAGIYKKTHKVKIIYMQHSYFTDGILNGGYTFYMKNYLLPKLTCLYNSFDAVGAVSYGVLKDIKKYFPNIKYGFVIYNPITDGNEIYIEKKINKNNIKLVTAGRLSQEKCQDLILKSVAKLNQAGYNATLDLYGEGDQEKNLKKLVISLNIADKINFCGYSCNLRDELKKYDIFVLTSRAESFGNVLVEAMSCSIPVISTNCPVGPREILENGKCGKLVSVNDITELTNAIIDVINDCDSEVVKKAFERSQEFSVSASIEQYERIFGGISENE